MSHRSEREHDRGRARSPRDSPPRKRVKRDHDRDLESSPKGHRDREERDNAREEKRRKKERKEEKRKAKAEKKEKKERKKNALDALQRQAEAFLHQKEPSVGKPPSQLISVEDHYYSHNREFRHWLKASQSTTWTISPTQRLESTLPSSWSLGIAETFLVRPDRSHSSLCLPC